MLFIGICGASGSGKTTLERLLINLYQPESGSIQLDGTDVRQIDPGDLRRNVGAVQQSPQLFYGSVRSNITMGHETAPDRAVLRAFHFYADNDRVPQQVAALRGGDFDAFLQLVTASGDSSWEYLQNVIPAGYKEHQEMGVTIAAAKHYLQGKGAVRVHGGGFAVAVRFARG